MDRERGREKFSLEMGEKSVHEWEVNTRTIQYYSCCVWKAKERKKKRKKEKIIVQHAQ